MKYVLLSLVAFTIGNFEISTFNKAIKTAFVAAVVANPPASLVSGGLILDEKITQLDDKEKWVLAPRLDFIATKVFWDPTATVATKVAATADISGDSKTDLSRFKGTLALKTNYMKFFRESAKLARQDEVIEILANAQNREDIFKALAAISIGEKEFLDLLKASVKKELDKPIASRTYRLEIAPTVPVTLSDDVLLERLVIDLSAIDTAKFELTVKSGRTWLSALEMYVKDPIVELITQANSKDKNDLEKVETTLGTFSEMAVKYLDGYLSGSMKP